MKTSQAAINRRKHYNTSPASELGHVTRISSLGLVPFGELGLSQIPGDTRRDR